MHAVLSLGGDVGRALRAFDDGCFLRHFAVGQVFGLALVRTAGFTVFGPGSPHRCPVGQ